MHFEFSNSICQRSYKHTSHAHRTQLVHWFGHGYEIMMGGQLVYDIYSTDRIMQKLLINCGLSCHLQFVVCNIYLFIIYSVPFKTGSLCKFQFVAVVSNVFYQTPFVGLLSVVCRRNV